MSIVVVVFVWMAIVTVGLIAIVIIYKLYYYLGYQINC